MYLASKIIGRVLNKDYKTIQKWRVDFMKIKENFWTFLTASISDCMLLATMKTSLNKRDSFFEKKLSIFVFCVVSTLFGRIFVSFTPSLYEQIQFLVTAYGNMHKH